MTMRLIVLDMRKYSFLLFFLCVSFSYSQVKKEKEEATGTSSASVQSVFNKKRVEKEKAARKTRIVTIIDNDQRVNNHVTTCTVNCSNSYFSLGTRVLPLGEKIEVAQGHINVLKEVDIPHHARDPSTGLSVSKLRKRFSISYEDVE